MNNNIERIFLQNLIIKKTEETPAIIFNPEKNIFQIIGSSLPENAIEFYEQIFDWFAEYKNSPNPETKIEFLLEYLSSSSVKLIAKLLYFFQVELLPHTKLTIIWYYYSEDSDMLDEGKRFSNFLKIPFVFIEQLYIQDDFIHKQTNTTPAVHLSKKDNIFCIEGNSIRMSSIYFFNYIFDWLKEYSNEPNSSMFFNFKLKNVNSENKKYYFTLLKILQKISNKSKIFIHWHYEQSNSFILEIGKDFQSLLNLNFEFIEY